MDIQAYIASGIIERYALGISSAEESRELEKLAVAHPEIWVEVNAIRADLESYAFEHAEIPPAFIKENLLSKIRDQKQGQKMAFDQPNRLISMNSPYGLSPALKLAAAAAIALLFISTLLNVVFYGNWKTSEKNLASLNEERKQVAEQLHSQKANYTIALNDLAVLRNADMVKMEMKGKEPAPDAKALVYCNFKTNEIFLDVQQLPTPPDSMQYQFWAIVKGKPIDGGMIDLCAPSDTCGIHKMNSIPDAHAFAISLEKKGGMTEPKGKIYAVFGI
jgi:anti-sigma-K factor RskA